MVNNSTNINKTDNYLPIISYVSTVFLYLNKGNAKRGVSPRLKIWPSDLDLWPWKSIEF
jgi:hypothetical protein